MPYIDTETTVAVWVRSVVGFDRVHCGGTSDVPPNLTNVVPVVMVHRYSGNDPVVTIDDANLDVDVYASTRDAALTIAETIRAAVRTGLVGQTIGGAVVLRADTIAAPTLLPWDAGPVRRVGASYRIRLHQPV